MVLTLSVNPSLNSVGTTADKKYKARKLKTFVPPFQRLQTLTAEG